MAYLNAQTLQKSILGKSMIASDPVRIQTVPNLQNVPGLKLKMTNQQWTATQSCVICKQPFNPQRNVNRHHCRLCGGSVCGQCSRKRVNNQRACDFCFLKQHLKKQEHQRKEQFRLREQSIAKMTADTKQFELQIDSLQKQIHQIQKNNIQLEITQAKQITQKQQQIKKKQEELKQKQEKLQKRKQDLNQKKKQLDTRQQRNKVFSSKVQIIKLDISSKQSSLLQKMEQLQRLKLQLEKLQVQKRQLMDQFK